MGTPGEDLWAQCDSETCKKWRKLPPGNHVDDNAPWYCWMNPDPTKNACSISEESYDMDGWAEDGDPAVSSKSKKKGKKPGGQQKGKTDSQRKRKRDEPYADIPGRGRPKRGGAHEQFQQGRARDAGRQIGVTRSRVVGELRKRGQKFLKTLNRERMSNRDADVNMMTPQNWKNICVHAPDAAKLACEAANWASAAKYFKKNGHDGKHLFDTSQSLHQLATRFATAVASANVAELLLEVGEQGAS